MFILLYHEASGQQEKEKNNYGTCQLKKSFRYEKKCWMLIKHYLFIYYLLYDTLNQP